MRCPAKSKPYPKTIRFLVIWNTTLSDSKQQLKKKLRVSLGVKIAESQSLRPFCVASCFQYRNSVQFERREQAAEEGTPGHTHTASGRQGKPREGAAARRPCSALQLTGRSLPGRRAWPVGVVSVDVHPLEWTCFLSHTDIHR